jgi:hypothetical protein
MPAMAGARRSLPSGYTEVATGDRRTDPIYRRVSYILHFAAAIFFVPLFAGVTAAVRPGRVLDPVDLWAVSVPGLGLIGSIAVMFFVVVAVLNLHMLLHAAAMRVFAGAQPVVTPRRMTVAVSAPEWYIPKRAMLLVVLTPFFLISAAGALLLAAASDALIAWIYVPLVANGVTSAGDILVLSWLVVTPAGTFVRHEGDRFAAFAPGT